MTQITDPKIQAVFDAYPPDARAGLLLLRDLILSEAAKLPDIGPIEESLKWAQPSYATPKSKAATPLRLGTHKAASFAIFAHCQTNVINTYATAYPGWDRLDGNRAVLFNDAKDVEPVRLSSLIRHALTYHL